MRNFQFRRARTKCARLHCAYIGKPKTLISLKLSPPHLVWLAAFAAMQVACATVPAARAPVMLAPPAVVGPSDWQTVHVMTRLARALDLVVPPTLR